MALCETPGFSFSMAGSKALRQDDFGHGLPAEQARAGPKFSW